MNQISEKDSIVLSNSSSNSENYECQVCFKKVSRSKRDYFKMQSCRHRFHKECLINYIQRVESNQKFNCCPSCKSPYNAEKILKQVLNIESNVTCVICYSPYNESDPPVSIQCNHFYHEKCILDWMKSCNCLVAPCPYCRKNYEMKDIKIRFDVLHKLQKQSQTAKKEEQLSTESNKQQSHKEKEVSTENSSDQDYSFISNNTYSSGESALTDKTSQTSCSITSTFIEDLISNTSDILLFDSQLKDQSINSSKLEEQPKQTQQDLSSQKSIIQELSPTNPIIKAISDPKNISSNEQYQIFVADLNGTQFVMNVNKSMTVKQLAQEIYKKTNIESEQLRFSCQGKGFSVQNNYDEFIGDLKVEKHSTVHLLLKLKGGRLF